MNRILIYLFLIIGITTYSQEHKTLKIYYGKLFTVSTDSTRINNINESKAVNYLLDLKKSIDKVEYILTIEKDYAKFEYHETLQDNVFNKTAITFGGGNTFFYDFKKNAIYKKGNLINDKLIKFEKDSIQWNLQNETKEIDGYICYKATGKTKIYKSDSSIKKEIEYEAWYCPQFNNYCGPSEFLGLPGLVFEASQKNSTLKFYLKKIEYIESTKEITIPKLKIISIDEEYSELNKIKKSFGL
ncbi:GLPGLI family protein [uncultured Flavobacterium sp.]|uniref:GLPGLI family protein n=1 Tax=uncultured Flavobacterium sp. TaxID=165435 RepID=UPI0030C8BCAB